MCAACRAESFWDSICDTPYDFPLRVLIVSLRLRPPPDLLDPAASAAARHTVSASFAAWRLQFPLFPQHWTFCLERHALLRGDPAPTELPSEQFPSPVVMYTSAALACDKAVGSGFA
jgi:hypothetical protein